MKNQINIAELLENCPKGMELYSPIFGKVYLDKVRPHLGVVVATDKYKEEFLYDGRYGMNGECMLFPSKENTTWEGFQRPFKDGDVVVAEDAESFQLFLLKHLTHSEDDNNYDGYCYFGWNFQCNELFEKGNWGFNRLATKKEKEKLFQAIKDNGFHWNTETKTLEKLVKPKFKVGDRIKYRSGEIIYRIVKITEDSYILDNLCSIPISIEHMYNLVPNKFDITTLKPFDKVLVRGGNGQKWTHDFFGFLDKDKGLPFVCVGHYVIQCIPYEGNEHLLGTTNDCIEYYKTW